MSNASEASGASVLVHREIVPIEPEHVHKAKFICKRCDEEYDEYYYFGAVVAVEDEDDFGGTDSVPCPVPYPVMHIYKYKVNPYGVEIVIRREVNIVRCHGDKCRKAAWDHSNDWCQSCYGDPGTNERLIDKYFDLTRDQHSIIEIERITLPFDRNSTSISSPAKGE